MSVTNITNLYFSTENSINDYYKFLVNQGDYQSRTIQANLYISKEKDISPLPYSLTSETVTITYEYVNSNGETINTGEFSCTKAISIGDYVITFLIPNVVVENYGTVRAQVKIYEDEYTVLNTALFKFYVSESLSVGFGGDDIIPLFTTPILNSGSPNTSTAGSVGQLYINIDNDELYYCSSIIEDEYTWVSITELTQATESTLGGIKAAAKGEGDTVEAKIDTTSGKLYVAASEYTLPQATDSTLGGIKADAKTSVDTIPVKIDAETGILYVSSSGSEDYGLITESI